MSNYSDLLELAIANGRLKLEDVGDIDVEHAEGCAKMLRTGPCNCQPTIYHTPQGGNRIAIARDGHLIEA